MKKVSTIAAAIGAALTVLMLTVLGARLSSTQAVQKTGNPVSPHTVIYLVRESMNGKLNSERIVSRSVNDRGEWYEENLYPKKGNSVAVLEDGHYLLDQEKGDKVQYKSATPRPGCIDWAEKMKAHAKDTVEILGLTAYVVEAKDNELLYERAYAHETGCTPLRARIKSSDGLEITYEALQVVFSVNSTFGKNMPVTKDISKE